MEWREPTAARPAEIIRPVAAGIIGILGFAVLGFVGLAWLLSQPFEIPCDCPRLEAQVESIAWVTDGDPTGDSLGSRGVERHEVILGYPASDPVAEVQRIADQLAAASLPVQTESDQKATFVDTGELLVHARADVELQEINIWVFINAPDENAPELLAPFATALGTRTTGSAWNEQGQLRN